jgi:hypothetical protein
MRWRGRGGLAVGLALSVAVWMALGVVTAGSPDRHDFGRAATKSAQRALSAVRTARLVGQAYLNGRVTTAFLSPLLTTPYRASSPRSRNWPGHLRRTPARRVPGAS